MPELSDVHAMAIERSCAVTAVALSGQRRDGVRLVTGQHRGFSLNSTLDVIHVPYPSPHRDWTRRTLTCGVALQCSPSKERIVEHRLNELSARELRAVTLVEAGVALGWVAENWPGLLVEMQRLVPDLQSAPADMDARDMLDRAIALARTTQPLAVDPLMGRLPSAYTEPHGLSDKLRRSFGRLPWTTTQKRTPAPHSVPGRRRWWCSESQPAPTKSAAGQRLRCHARPPSRDSVSRMERVDEKLHAGPRRSAGTRTQQP